MGEHDAIDMGIDVHLGLDGAPRVIERRFRVEEAYAGHRLDHYLKRKIPRLSRTKLQALIRTRLEPLGDRQLKPHSRVTAGDELVLRYPARPEPPCPRTFTVLYEDAHVMVIDKPAGLPVHASARYYYNTLTRVLLERYPDEALQICHRLDRETSGIVVLARGRAMAARVKGSFAAHRVRKAYLALVHGQPTWPLEPEREPAPAIADGLDATSMPARWLDDDHIIDLPLALVRAPDALIDIRMEVSPGAAAAVTRARVVERRDHCCLVRCLPVTGRQHQIRAHLAAVGYPIVGDKLYAHGDAAFAAFCDGGMTDDLLARFQLARHALHAAAIVVPHPATGDPLTVTCPLPADMRDFVGQPLAPATDW